MIGKRAPFGSDLRPVIFPAAPAGGLAIDQAPRRTSRSWPPT
ncbi:hypothetical protein A7982_13609 [Minicystis rosea]|nr:hypothetical protein A7982_13609 [Minicystis rosea]